MSQQPARDPGQTLWPPLLLPLIALCIVAPLLFGGPSCGHDFGFHMQSWIDAGDQIRHGHLYPRWAFSPAYNAGEPRFTFYPPVSWLLGSLLLQVLPASAPAVFTWLALSGAALAMYVLALPFTTRRGALLAATAYVANPYVLFTAFERTAYAELLAAAWLPLLFRAALATRPSALAIAAPVALLWLTNAPAAVMGTYALGLIMLTRAVLVWRRRPEPSAAARLRTLTPLLTPAAAGLCLGLGLSGFYLLPAAWERRYVQIAMAIIPNMRVEDNFLFGHTGYGPHDQVLHTASLVGLALLALTAVALVFAYLRRPAPSPVASGDLQEQHSTALWPSVVLGAIAAVLLWHATLPVWHVLPELQFLQFPWRLLAVIGCVFGLSVALALGQLRLPATLVTVLALGIAALASSIAIRPFRQGCEAQELPPARLALYASHHGVGPTDEYTPTEADNDHLRWDDPAWWLTTDPNAPGPHTVPNPAETILDYDQPPPLEQTVSAHAPVHLDLHLQQPETLVVNLRDYPAWRVTLNGRAHPPHVGRDDGLLAVALPPGEDVVDIRWHTLPDMWAGDMLSAAALALAVCLAWRSRRIRP